jgi:beta-1,4-mannosyltransferase
VVAVKSNSCKLKVGAERKVTFDNGPDSSVCEDTFFGLVAASQGYSFGFIEGEMWEKSPFGVVDFLQQRKRWLQGLLLVVHSSRIPIMYNGFISTDEDMVTFASFV